MAKTGTGQWTSHSQDSDERLGFSNMTGFAEEVYIRW